ncbi:MAG: 4-hydroxy-tetrahydrodipicolinate reductase [Brumimicrobium sp.]|nr:4-hydroxy-tetrahydrodipicolinate reductase [Brumimicrobium sp.]
MKIALVGYGKMGKAIEQIALERGHTIVAKITKDHTIEDADLTNADVAIDFSTPHAVLANIHFLVSNKIPSVIGTTGWNDSLKEVTQKVLANDTVLLHASNFSIGVNIFFQLNEELAKLMNPYKDYTVEMEEIHHTQKLDAPSGTAITLAEGVIKNHGSYNSWNCPQNEKRNIEAQDSIKIEAIREHDVKGTHSIYYQSDIDTITITHEAHNRKGFALGAVIAAEWIIGKKGVYTMRDLMKYETNNS